MSVNVLHTKRGPGATIPCDRCGAFGAGDDQVRSDARLLAAVSDLVDPAVLPERHEDRALTWRVGALPMCGLETVRQPRSANEAHVHLTCPSLRIFAPSQ